MQNLPTYSSMHWLWSEGPMNISIRVLYTYITTDTKNKQDIDKKNSVILKVIIQKYMYVSNHTLKKPILEWSYLLYKVIKLSLFTPSRDVHSLTYAEEHGAALLYGACWVLIMNETSVRPFRSQFNNWVSILHLVSYIRSDIKTTTIRIFN